MQNIDKIRFDNKITTKYCSYLEIKLIQFFQLSECHNFLSDNSKAVILLIFLSKFLQSNRGKFSNYSDLDSVTNFYIS